MKLRPTPSFLVAVAALLVAFTGGAVAGSQIGSAQIKNNSVTTKDIKNNTVTTTDIKNGTIRGQDIKNRSIPPNKLSAPRCADGEATAFGQCAVQVVAAKVSFETAQDACAARDGRLPSYSDLGYLYGLDDFQWANGDVGQYEWVSDVFDEGSGPRPSARDASGNPITDTGSSTFYYHCLIPER